MPEKLWMPDEERIRNTNMFRFMTEVNEQFSLDLKQYSELYQWSIEHISDFWAAFWSFAGIKASKSYDKVIDDVTRMPGAKWFPGARLNFAENLLRFRDDRVALVFRGEDRERTSTTYAQLYEEVTRLAASLKKVGIRPGDQVAGFVPNMPQSITAMLAATSLGATWSSCSPDFGIKGVLDRFGQTRPRVLFVANGYWFKGKKLDSLDKVASILNEIPDIEKVVVIPYTEKDPEIAPLPNAVLYADFLSKEDCPELEFAQLPSDTPLYIMYSSGTTGLPKCMVQGAGGVLINQLKEQILHTDLKRDDTIFYFTTCGWMMWNWLVSALGVGATIVLYDGNPFHPDPGALWKMAEEEKITVFGTSAGFLAALKDSGVRPGHSYDLSSLRAILSTGSPLSVDGFHFVYDEIKKDLQLSSISGGSDINGCFALGNPMGSVYEGELQCRGLGMKVEAFDDTGKPVINQQGELVCTAPAPSMPLYFWDDPEMAKYKSAYFDVYPDIWRHGDFIEINERGGVVIYGRSDATLNPGGVRIGTAEIYRQVETIDEIEDSVVVGQSWRNDIRVVLFVKLAEGSDLTGELVGRIKKAIRDNASPRHVPAKIISVPDIPYTLNMKKVELAVKKVIEGKEILNKDSLSNPKSLEYFKGLRELEND